VTADKPAALSNDEILEILQALNESRFDELRLEVPGLKLVLSRDGAAKAEPVPEPAPAPEAVAVQAQPAPPRQDEGLLAVRSPILGIFYRAPQPGAPPFVEVGSEVGPDDAVGLIEVMKLFNTVSAGVAGKIARVCAENAAMVEEGQVLFLVEPASR
jgi:acetyl-CoA carboxylase biotin carboxyl carrier protein